jgi:hypothetical protein
MQVTPYLYFRGACEDALKFYQSCGLGERTAQGGYFIWVERRWLDKLEALRQPGEGLSETIIRLAAMEAGGRPRRRAAELFGATRHRRSQDESRRP